MLGAYAISNQIKSQTFLQELSFRNTLDFHGLLTICGALGTNKSITKLDLSQTKFGEAALQVGIMFVER
jgi:hypothetical protein